MARVRGEFVDIGGRRLRAVRAGPAAARLLILLEHGAYGCAADWAVVQDKLASRGLRSLAYDRAGLGLSDPGPEPRDGEALNADLEALLKALGESGPYLLVGHSMGGLPIRIFAHRRAADVKGLVFVDAVVPEVLRVPGALSGVKNFGRLLKFASFGAKFGMMGPVSGLTANLIGLSGEPAEEKRRFHASSRHAHSAAQEVAGWPAMSALAEAVIPEELPAAVVTAGATWGLTMLAAWGPNMLKSLQETPARRSRHGYVEHVPGCNHSNLLGPEYADAILRGVEHVLDRAGLGALALDEA